MAESKAKENAVTAEDAQKLYEEAQRLNEETKKLLEEFKTGKTEVNAVSDEDAETISILEGIKANEARMKDKVPLRIDIDSLNRSNKHLFCGVGTDAVKIERDKTVRVSRAMYDSVMAAIEQEKKAFNLMDKKSSEWKPDAWKTGEI